jgi:hypothetical protein
MISKKCFLLLFVHISSLAIGQNHIYPTIKYDAFSLEGKLKRRTNSFGAQTDSLQLRLPNISHPKLSNRFSHSSATPDSLRAVHELDSIKTSLAYKIDSLKGLRLPTDKYTRQLDSVKQISPAKYMNTARQKIDKMEADIQKKSDDINQRINAPVDKVDEKINNVENRVNEKLEVMRREGGEGSNIPGNVNADLPNTKGLAKDGLNTDLKLPGADLNATDITGNLDNPIGEQMNQVGEIKEKANDLKNLPNEQLQRIRSAEEIKTVQEKVGDLNKSIDDVQAYGEDAKNIAKGNVEDVKALPDAIENKAKNIDAVKELEKQNAEIAAVKELVGKGNDTEALKQEAMKQVLAKGREHFVGKQEALQGAMEKVAKLKSKYTEVSSIKDLPKRAPNPVKGIPVVERIIPGLTLQFLKEQNFMIDVNPVMAWRFTGRLNAGLGWNERLSFAKWNRLEKMDRIFGPRAFGSYGFRKGVSAKVEVERMNAFIPAFTINPDAGSRQWLWSVFVGLKKDYKFFGNIKGNVQMLYNLYDDHDNSPYIDRLNVRMGFEFPIKKKKKPVG